MIWSIKVYRQDIKLFCVIGSLLFRTSVLACSWVAVPCLSFNDRWLCFHRRKLGDFISNESIDIAFCGQWSEETSQFSGQCALQQNSFSKLHFHRDFHWKGIFIAELREALCSYLSRDQNWDYDWVAAWTLTLRFAFEPEPSPILFAFWLVLSISHYAAMISSTISYSYLI